MDNPEPSDYIDDVKLVNDIKKWDKVYSARYDSNDPASSLTMTDSEVVAMDIFGLMLAKRLAKYVKEKADELPYKVSSLCLFSSILEDRVTDFDDALEKIASHLDPRYRSILGPNVAESELRNLACYFDPRYLY